MILIDRILTISVISSVIMIMEITTMYIYNTAVVVRATEKRTYTHGVLTNHRNVSIFLSGRW